LLTTKDAVEERPETRIGPQTFNVFLSEIATWARDEKIVMNGFQQRVDREVADHELIDRLFLFWDYSCRGALSFQDLVTGLSGVIFNDLMDNIEWFFNLHDKNKDGFLTKDEVLTVSESLLFIFRFEIGDAYLGAVSRFMSNAFEYGDALLPRPEGADGEDDTTPHIESNQPYLSLATFRMVLLADEVLESFFETDFSASFRLEPVPLMELPAANSSILGGLWSNIVTDSNVKLFHKLSDEVGKTIGRHQVIHRPSIGRYTSIEDTRPRESLLTPGMRRSSSKSSLKSNTSSSSVVEGTSRLTVGGASSRSSGASATLAPPSSTLAPTAAAAAGRAEAEKLPVDPTSPGVLDPLAQVTNVVANAFMERTPFAIDDAGDEDEDDEEDDVEEAGEDDVLDEVDAFLEAHDTGVTDADREVAKDLRAAKPL